MKVVVPAEVAAGERRVAILPAEVARYRAAGLEVTVQSRAGVHALASDDAYRAAGAQVVDAVEAATVDVLLHVRPLSPQAVGKLRSGAITLGFCAPSAERETVRALRDAGVTSFAMELLPRLAGTASMDARSSQDLVAGYHGVLAAAVRLPRLFPRLTTAAGTLPPVRVLVLGAGVAGLQAIATARRLGAVVAGYAVPGSDVRAGVRAGAGEIASVGGTPLDLGPEPAGGTVRPELLAPHVIASDVVITTVVPPDGPAPRLVTAATLAAMRPGGVVVDLAAGAGGNVAGSRPGEDVEIDVGNGGVVRLVGLKDAAGALPAAASRLYSANLANLLLRMTRDGVVVPDLDDEIVAATCLTHGGVVRHAATAALLGAGLATGLATGLGTGPGGRPGGGA